MAAADVQTASQPPASEPAAPSIPDYMLDPNAILKDQAAWRHGQAPDYSSTRRVWEATKSQSHSAGSLENMVENLVKNWEIEASHKIQVSDWRTVDPNNYTFSINGGPPQDAEHMLKVGTYNAVIAPSQFYDPSRIDYEESHKLFRNMMPNFAWEVLEVYSGPPVVAFKWRHWGEMKQDYVGRNSKGEEITIKAHGGALDIQGMTVAKLSDKLQVTALETWFDPVEMFNQMKPDISKVTSVEVNGRELDKQEATDLLENSAEGSNEQALVDHIKDGSQGQDVGKLIEGEPLVQQPDVHVLNPSVPGHSGQEHSEVREQHVGNAGQSRGGGSCPFIAGQSRS